MEMQLSHSISPVTLLALISRTLGLDGVSGVDQRAIRGVVTLQLDADETQRLTLAIRRGDLPGVEVVALPPEASHTTRLVLTRRPGEGVAIGGDVEVVIDS